MDGATPAEGLDTGRLRALEAVYFFGRLNQLASMNSPKTTNMMIRMVSIFMVVS